MSERAFMFALMLIGFLLGWQAHELAEAISYISVTVECAEPELPTQQVVQKPAHGGWL